MSYLGLIFICVLAFLARGSSETHNNHDKEPRFSAPIKNITVSVGREAILSCYVENLEGYKVGWMRAADQTVLALQGRVVTHNSRYGVIHEELNLWKLKINNVRESDRGCYMCQINTTPLKKQSGCIDVHLPPDISDSESSSDLTINEGQNALLYCTANGHPTPRITWRRDDGSQIILRNNQTDTVQKFETYSGNYLNFFKVDRRQMGAYLCIAANDVPPAVSKRVLLNVHFAPNVTTPNTLFGAFERSNVEVECYVESYPRPVNYWIKESVAKGHQSAEKSKQKMLQQSKKYEITEEVISSYRTRMLLTIKNFNELDAGIYTCISSNTLGRANSTIRIYEVKVPTTEPTTIPTTIPTTTTTTRRTTRETTTLAPTTQSTTTTTELVIEYITFTPGLLDHYAGESYLNQPHLNIAYSNSSSWTLHPLIVTTLVLNIVVAKFKCIPGS